MEKAIEVTVTQENSQREEKMRTKSRNTDRRTSAGVSTLIYRDLLLSTTQYTKRKRVSSFKIKTYSVCILLYIFTHAQTN